MKKNIALLTMLSLCWLPACGQPVSPTATPPTESRSTADVARTLDALHERASEADEAAYFSLFAPNALFVGTDATEAWSLEQFRAYTHERFATGTGWTYHPNKGDRKISFASDGRTAWFYESLTHERYGQVRGSGVVVFLNGQWRISQYVLSFPIPNEKTQEVVQLIN